MTYTFPFTTCEIPKKESLVAQPYSVFINIISSLIILSFLLVAKTTPIRLLLVCILSFELVHSFSHAVHLKKYSQTMIIHCLAYAVNIALLYALYQHFHVFPDPVFLFFLLLVVLFDIYALFRLPIIFYISTQIFLFISLIVYYYRSFSKEAGRWIQYMVFLGILLLVLIVNETYNCKSLLRLFNGFPFHTLVEMCGLFFFYLSCKLFATFDK
jgi:hypothetical protein